MTATLINLPAGFDRSTAAAIAKLNPSALVVLPPGADEPAPPVDHSKETISVIAGLILNGVAGLVTGGAAPLVAAVAKAGAAGIEAWLTGTTKERHTTEEILASGASIPDPQT